MKPGSRDTKAYLQFTLKELDLLQENTEYMTECFGLDSRIEKLTGKRKVGFYAWDLESLEEVLFWVEREHAELYDPETMVSLRTKINEAKAFIEQAKF